MLEVSLVIVDPNGNVVSRSVAKKREEVHAEISKDSEKASIEVENRVIQDDLLLFASGTHFLPSPDGTVWFLRPDAPGQIVKIQSDGISEAVSLPQLQKAASLLQGMTLLNALSLPASAC